MSYVILAFFVLSSSIPAHADHFAAAFLENGVGSRGIGMGAAFVAVADDASASYWNPAGLAWVTGKEVRTSLQPLSLDRVQSSLSLSLNVRGDLAFGFTWVHAGVDEIQGRAVSGLPTGFMDDSENAFYVAVGRPVGRRLAVGGAVKILDQRIDVPDWKKATASGYGFDMGVCFRLDEKTMLAAVFRNASARLKWKVQRSSQQASTTKDDLPATWILGLSHRPLSSLLLAADLYQGDESHIDVGAEWRLSPLLTVRGGIERLADETCIFATGLTLRPMRRETLQFHYAYATDPLETSGRTSFGLTLRF